MALRPFPKKGKVLTAVWNLNNSLSTELEFGLFWVFFPLIFHRVWSGKNSPEKKSTWRNTSRQEESCNKNQVYFTLGFVDFSWLNAKLSILLAVFLFLDYLVDLQPSSHILVKCYHSRMIRSPFFNFWFSSLSSILVNFKN